MKERIYTNEDLCHRLQENLTDAAQRLGALKAVIDTNCPAARWNANFVWALEQYPEAKRHLCQKIHVDAAERAGLACEYGAKIVSEDTRLNRKFVEMQTGTATKAIEAFKIDSYLAAYLRAGAITFGRSGAVTIADNSAELIQDYCSVFVESNAEKALFEKITALQKAGQALQAAHAGFVDALEDKAAKRAAAGYAGRFDAGRMYLYDGLHLASDSCVWRTFVGFCARLRKADKPRFYNTAGTPKISIAELYEVTGYNPEVTPELRYKFPALYKNEAYTDKFSPCGYADNPEGLKELRAFLDESGSTITESGQISRPDKRIGYAPILVPSEP